jgi:hypothetical protein
MPYVAMNKMYVDKWEQYWYIFQGNNITGDYVLTFSCVNKFLRENNIVSAMAVIPSEYTYVQCESMRQWS